jgi:hypothetical protein
MWELFLAGYAAFSAVLAWRLVNVVVHSPDDAHRQSAIRMFTTVWSSASLAAGLVAAVVKLHEIGAL